jgi:hypothetical protein
MGRHDPRRSGIAAAFFGARIAQAVYARVPLLWRVPDRRVERFMGHLFGHL